MNWQAISFDWNQVRAFYATCEQGSFSGAARALKTTQPTIGRQISALEEGLGVTLVERSVKGLKITEVGYSLLEYVKTMSDAAAMISMIAEGSVQNLEGEVTLAATDLMASAILPPILMQLRNATPSVRIKIVAANHIQNLIEREADIAIRHVRPQQTELIAQRVAEFSANLYASSAYLDDVGRPRSLSDLKEHKFIANADPTQLISRFRSHGLEVREDQFAISSDHGTVSWEYLKAGFGIGIQPSGLGDTEPGIERVFGDFPSLKFPVWLVTHRELRTSPRIRAVFDALACGLREFALVA